MQIADFAASELRFQQARANPPVRTAILSVRVQQDSEFLPQLWSPRGVPEAKASKIDTGMLSSQDAFMKMSFFSQYWAISECDIKPVNSTSTSLTSDSGTSKVVSGLSAVIVKQRLLSVDTRD